MAGVLATAVAVHGPTGTVWLSRGESPDPELAALITAPSAWEGGAAPEAPTEDGDTSPDDGGDDEGAEPETQGRTRRRRAQQVD